MKNSEKSSNPKSTGIPKWILVSWLVVAIIGFIDAAYLTVAHYQGHHTTCSLTQRCDIVLMSEWSEVAGIPVALGGTFYYLFMLAGVIYFWQTSNHRIFRLFATFSLTGLLASAWFFYLQKYVIGAYCQYCLLSALTSTLLFVFGMLILQKYKNLNNSHVQFERDHQTKP